MKEKILSLPLSLSLLLLASFSSAFFHGPASSTTTWTLDLPPRLQWENNCGYCGEVSLICAGLYFGQYISQYDSRLLDCDKKNCTQLCKDQLLVGTNDVYAAEQMHLTAEEWDPDVNSTTTLTSEDFLVWIRTHVIAGHPVSIGLFMNMYIFYGSTNPSAGSRSYDHIVPVTGWESRYPPDDQEFHSDDVITFSDNGVYSTWLKTPYNFSYTLGDFLLTRQEANAEDGPVYSLKDGRNYGMAVLGLANNDANSNNGLLPVRVYTDLNSEKPVIKDGSNTRPAPCSLTLSVVVSSLSPNVRYNLYRYSSFANVPSSRFNGQSSLAAEKVSFSVSSGTTYTHTDTIESSEMAIYRAVLASAP